MIEPVFVLPVGVGIVTVLSTFALFKWGGIDSRYFAIALSISGILIFSPFIFSILELIKQLFGIQFTFVLGFGIAITVLLSLVVYLLLVVGKLRNEIVTLWQEIALLENELEDSDPPQ
jgi:hypothetical protein